MLLLAPREDPGPCRLGVVASKRVGNAVARNRGKRRVREWFRENSRVPSATDLVVVLRVGAPALSAAQTEAELDQALGRALNGRRGTPADRGRPRDRG